MKLDNLNKYFADRYLWWVFVGSYFIFVYMPRFLVEGMFGDGLTYSSIARNMAIGKGTFWAPYFSSSFWLPYNSTTVFYEHPPLAIYLQSLLFKLFGDQLYVEKIYCFLIFISTIIAISLVWRCAFKNSAYKNWDWLPAIVWMGMSEVEWTVPNNMLDNTQALFCIWSAYLVIVSLQNRKKSWMSFLSGICVFLGVLSKGPVSLFVVVLPTLYWFIIDRRTNWLRISLYQLIGLLIPIIYCVLDPSASYFLSKYVQQQFLSAILGNREITEGGAGIMSHLHIFSAIYTQISPALVLLILVIVLFIWKNGLDELKKLKIDRTCKISLLFLLVAMAGSFPIALSLKQADYYLLPSTPFYAIGLGSLFIYFREKIVNLNFLQISKIWYFSIVSLIFCTSLIFASSFIGKKRKYEKEIMHDLPILHKHIPNSSKIWVCHEMMTDFNIHTYFQRYFQYELTENPSETVYFLVQTGCVPPERKDLTKLDEPFERFSLYLIRK